MTSKDPLHFVDTKKICRSIERCDGKNKLKDAVVGKSKGKLVICCGFLLLSVVLWEL
jgi:acetyl-CoA carboxylase carboxyl transferase subunit beta